MGDGVGILIQILDVFYCEEMVKQGVNLLLVGEYGVGMIFLLKENVLCFVCEQEFECMVKVEGQVVFGWCDVLVDYVMLILLMVKVSELLICQIFIGCGKDIMVMDVFEWKLYVICKIVSYCIQVLKFKYGKEYFVLLMLVCIVVYKGLLLVGQVGVYYCDLQDECVVLVFVFVYQCFLINMFLVWELVYLYWMIVYNGEINIVKGNVNWLNVCIGVIVLYVFVDDLLKLWLLIYLGQLDIVLFDNCFELLVMVGYLFVYVVMMMILEVWEQYMLMDENCCVFYEYYVVMMELWDGLVVIVFIDGCQIGVMFDCNGLCLVCYIVIDDDFVIMVLEVGMLLIFELKIVKKWCLQLGKMFLIDMEYGCIIDDKELKDNFVNVKLYKSWIDVVCIKFDEIELKVEEVVVGCMQGVVLFDCQQVFGYMQEDLKFLMVLMVVQGEEVVGLMGNDLLFVVMLNKNKMFYYYFKQLFVQVMNLLIDLICENMVMLFVLFIGLKLNLFDINNINLLMCFEVLQLVFDFKDIVKICVIDQYMGGKFSVYELNICYLVVWGKEGIEVCFVLLCVEVVDVVKLGYNILIVLDCKMDVEYVVILVLFVMLVIYMYFVQ